MNGIWCCSPALRKCQNGATGLQWLLDLLACDPWLYLNSFNDAVYSRHKQYHNVRAEYSDYVLNKSHTESYGFIRGQRPTVSLFLYVRYSVRVCSHANSFVAPYLCLEGLWAKCWCQHANMLKLTMLTWGFLLGLMFTMVTTKTELQLRPMLLFCSVNWLWTELIDNPFYSITLQASVNIGKFRGFPKSLGFIPLLFDGSPSKLFQSWSK